MFGNNPTLRFPGNLMQVRSINELRGVSPYEMNDEAAILVTGSGLFTFDASSLANDNGKTVIRPDGFTPLQSGRWVQSGAQTAENTFASVALLQASGLSVAYLVGDPVEPDGLFTGPPGALARQKADGISTSRGPNVDQSLVTIFDRGSGTSSVMEKTLERAGAVGNNDADDFQAMQDALSEIEFNVQFETYASNTPFLGAGELVWPQGVFLSSDALKLTRSLRIRGEGNAEYSSGARIQQQTPGKDLFRMEPIAQGASLSLANLVLRANGGGGLSGGSLIRVTNATGKCNTIRIDQVLFGTPQRYAVNIDSADDVISSRCLYDVSALGAVQLGSASGSVTRYLSTGDRFFAIYGTCVEVYNGRTVQFQNPQVYGNEDAAGNPTGSRTPLFLDGYNNNAIKLHSVGIYNGSFQAVNQLVAIGNGGLSEEVVRDFAFIGNNGRFLGAGDTSLPAIDLHGTISGSRIIGNTLTGSYGSQPFISDAAAAVTGAVITDNFMTNTGGGGPAMLTGNSSGVIANNGAASFAQNSVGHRWVTSGSAVSPGAVAAGAAVELTFPVVGALAGDSAKVDPAGGVALAPDGINVTSYVTAGTLHVRYYNHTAASITVPSHDISARVTR